MWNEGRLFIAAWASFVCHETLHCHGRRLSFGSNGIKIDPKRRYGGSKTAVENRQTQTSTGESWPSRTITITHTIDIYIIILQYQKNTYPGRFKHILRFFFHIELDFCLILSSQTCLGSGQTWHMRKIIFIGKKLHLLERIKQRFWGVF
jgi:hypothetical protein